MSYEGRSGTDLNVLTLFGSGIAVDGPIDARYLGKLPNADSARAALRFMSDQANEIELCKRHTRSDIEYMWKAVFRGCLAHGVQIPQELAGYARRLGVVTAS